MVSCIWPPLLAWLLRTTGFVWSSDEVAVHLEFRLGSSSLSSLRVLKLLETSDLPGVSFLPCS